MTAQPEIEAFHDPATGSLSYLVIDGDRRRAAIIDPVL
ncbi:MAG: MBL fold metallo-hydrolase, partial [Alphaproteobacteria bacterium]|nr:MBL fold metallo-hydrolase [Alphaproteobacteria bacterium]